MSAILRLATVTLIVFALAACAASSTRRLNAISVGMTKAEVIQVMGQPESTRAQDGVEFLIYSLASSFLDTDGSDTSQYFVRLQNGRVDAYGERGDFDTTSTPVQRIEVEVK